MVLSVDSLGEILTQIVHADFWLGKNKCGRGRHQHYTKWTCADSYNIVSEIKI